MRKFFKEKAQTFKYVFSTMLFAFCYQMVYSQNGGAAGINSAATAIKSYVASMTTLAYAVGGVVGIIGGIRIYIKWTAGEDVNKELMGWGGAFIFLMVVPTVVKGFFG